MQEFNNIKIMQDCEHNHYIIHITFDNQNWITVYNILYKDITYEINKIIQNYTKILPKEDNIVNYLYHTYL